MHFFWAASVASIDTDTIAEASAWIATGIQLGTATAGMVSVGIAAVGELSADTQLLGGSACHK